MANPKCKYCELETVEISDQTLQDMRAMHPNIRSLAARPKNGWWRICAGCDQYALGREMTRGFPIRTSSGEISEVNQLLADLGLEDF
jgi:hypothetical protein